MTLVPSGRAGRRDEASSAAPVCLHTILTHEIERPGDRERLGNAVLRSSVAHEHVDLVRLRAEQDVSDRASTREALEARSVHAAQGLERSATRVPRSAAGGRDRAPADDHHHGTRRRNPVGGDRTQRRLRPSSRRSDHEECPRVDHRAVANRLHLVPAGRDDDPNAVRRDDPPAAARRRKRREHEGGEERGNGTHVYVYGSPRASGPRRRRN